MKILRIFAWFMPAFHKEGYFHGITQIVLCKIAALVNQWNSAYTNSECMNSTLVVGFQIEYIKVHRAHILDTNIYKTCSWVRVQCLL